jgi:hypothetical protein
VPSAAINGVVAEAARSAGVEVEEVDILKAEAVTWSDGSLGCPQPGQMYTQALVPGYRVVVRIGDEELSFHSGRDEAFVLCADPQPPVGDGAVDR